MKINTLGGFTLYTRKKKNTQNSDKLKQKQM